MIVSLKKWSGLVCTSSNIEIELQSVVYSEHQNLPAVSVYTPNLSEWWCSLTLGSSHSSKT